MTPDDFQKALDDMPDIVGTPGTGAFIRSCENLLKWYDGHYKVIRRALEQACKPKADYHEGLHRIIMARFSEIVSMEDCRNLEIEILSALRQQSPSEPVDEDVPHGWCCDKCNIWWASSPQSRPECPDCSHPALAMSEDDIGSMEFRHERSKKDVRRQFLPHDTGGVILQGTMAYNPHDYQVVERQQSPSTDAVESLREECIEALYSEYPFNRSSSKQIGDFIFDFIRERNLLKLEKTPGDEGAGMSDIEKLSKEVAERIYPHAMDKTYKDKLEKVLIEWALEIKRSAIEP